jgi:hypothetical protein
MRLITTMNLCRFIVLGARRPLAVLRCHQTHGRVRSDAAWFDPVHSTELGSVQTSGVMMR